jgi:hypothetical protein
MPAVATTSLSLGLVSDGAIEVDRADVTGPAT